MKLYVDPCLSVGAPAAALKNELAVDTVKTARNQRRTVRSRCSHLIQPLFSLSELSEVPSHKQQCVFNQRPIIHLHWFCSQQKKEKQKTGNCLYFTGSIFPISLLSAPSRPEPSGRHIMCLNAVCAYVSVFVSLWTDVCVYN